MSDEGFEISEGWARFAAHEPYANKKLAVEARVYAANLMKEMMMVIENISESIGKTGNVNMVDLAEMHRIECRWKEWK